MASSSSLNSAIVLMGPTASGKSALGLELARRLGGEIVSADSMQLYKGLDIGTAKPSKAEMAEIPHHLIGILDISERADLFSFRDLAEKTIMDIRARGRVPIVVGGTGLYLRALIYGLDPMPADLALRKELNSLYDSEEGFPKLKERMAAEDPSDLAKWSSHRRRLLRALEVFLLAGKPMCELQKTWPESKPRQDMRCFKLLWPRELLKERIASRCEAMLSSGWIEEAKALLDKGLLETPTARQALGYSLIAGHLAGRLDRKQLSDSIKTATWQYARRQMTWFRNQHPEAFELSMPDALNFDFLKANFPCHAGAETTHS